MESMKESIGKIKESLTLLSEALGALSEEIKGYQKVQKKAPKTVKPKVSRAKAVKKKAAARKAAAPAKVKKTAPEVVLGIIQSSTGGVKVAVLKEKTGYNEKKIANSIYRLKKQGKIKTTGRGVYTIA